MKNRKFRLISALAFTLCLASCAAAGEAPAAPTETTGTLDVFFFNVGKADSILLRQGQHTLLIDAATDKSAEHVLKRLREEGITRLDALLITHEDKDHIGGADHVLRNFSAGQIYVGEIMEESKQVRQFSEALSEQNREAARLRAGDRFELGGATVTVLGPIGRGYEQENDCSLVVRVDFGETSMLFAGDAEKPALADLLSAPNANEALRAQVLKVPHHGRIEDVSAAFFSAVQPQIAVISTVWDASEGLPDEATLHALRHVGADTFVTADGEVRVSSDGKAVTLLSPAPEKL